MTCRSMDALSRLRVPEAKGAIVESVEARVLPSGENRTSTQPLSAVSKMCRFFQVAVSQTTILPMYPTASKASSGENATEEA